MPEMILSVELNTTYENVFMQNDWRKAQEGWNGFWSDERKTAHSERFKQVWLQTKTKVYRTDLRCIFLL